MKTPTLVAKTAFPPQSSRFDPVKAVILLVLLAWFAPSASGNNHWKGKGPKHDLTVMTRNLYVGADFGLVTDLDPTDPMYLSKLVEAVTTVSYTILVQNDFRIRAAGIADEIVAEKPDLVGLQEASIIRLQSPGDLAGGGTTPATVVVIDYLQVLLQALADRGAHYAAVAITTNADVELPVLNMTTGGLDDIRLTDHDVILARTDLPRPFLRVSNPQHGNFETSLAIPSIGLEFIRGWCSVDASIGGRTVRFINMHLEEETSPEIQWMQAQELLAGPAHVALPVILVGDGNTDGNLRNGTVTYTGLLRSGFRDAWTATHRRALGLTWGHDPMLADPTVSFVWRIDLILSRGMCTMPVKSDRFDTPLHRSEPPFWASDHAGVSATFLLR